MDDGCATVRDERKRGAHTFPHHLLQVKVLTVFPQMYGSWGTSRFGSKSVKVRCGRRENLTAPGASGGGGMDVE